MCSSCPMSLTAFSRSRWLTKEYSRPPVYSVKSSAGLSTKIAALHCQKLAKFGAEILLRKNLGLRLAGGGLAIPDFDAADDDRNGHGEKGDGDGDEADIDVFAIALRRSRRGPGVIRGGGFAGGGVFWHRLTH